jgi:ABC-type transport system involved in multi-copper enzyme maturation permease subunit
MTPGSGDVARVLSGEALKFRRRRSSVVLPIIIALLAGLISFGIDAAARNNWFGLPSGFFVAASSIAWITNVMTLVLVIVASFAVSQEYALGTVKAAWVRPIGRSGWFTGKLLSACFVVAALFVLAVAVVAAMAFWRAGFADLMEKDYLIHTARSMGIRMLLTTGLTLGVVWSATVVTAAVATRLNHAGGAIAVVLGLGVAMMALSVFPPVRPFLLTTYLGLPSEQMVAMSKGLPLPLEWRDLIWRTLAASGIYAAVAYLLGRRAVERKEITS